MSLLKNALKINFNLSQKFSTKPRLTVELNKRINADLEKELYKPKYHPGKLNLVHIELPKSITAAIKICANDIPITQLIGDGTILSRKLFARHPPLEKNQIHWKRKDIQRNILKNAGIEKMEDIDNVENEKRMKDQISYEVDKEYYKTSYNWQPMVYDDYKALTYAYGRSALEYATVLSVFSEIAKRDPEFKPQSFFDFGAGIGTGTWAASQLWKNSLHEYFLVDTSREMNDLSDLILRNGNPNKAMNVKNVYYRQFLPASSEAKSHMVLSAYSLMELPDIKTRLETLLTLWNKCAGYMVIIENGTNAGFQLVNEAKEFLMAQAKTMEPAYIFAPCPHEELCPRIALADGTPCNFQASYRPLQLGEAENIGSALFSYVVLKKGSRSDDSTINWPRMVRPTMVRARHTRCQMCTHRGKLEEIIITHGKHSKYTYRCARKSDWGDRMPVTIEEQQSEDSET